ncbi:MAG: heavy metal translocating P-type ATPase, partial [Candidatus Bathyarchaeota archaeon]|nr:heavy metal translocating P-type ATPase [Candidatus Bathyarchaeota archaeon]
IRDRRAFEMVKDIDAVVFDKTGTLTEGKFGVTDVIAYIPEEQFLALTASVELNSEHIIAKAIVDYAKNKGTKIPKSKDFRALPGKGAYGKVARSGVYVGSQALLQEMKIPADAEDIRALHEHGKTVIFTVVDGKLAGAFALADKIRPESAEATAKLKALGLKVYMLTGDSDAVAKWVAKDLGIEEYFAEVLPGQKSEVIKALKAKGYKVAMVGDGINDAPALVTADVGIAIGAGTDVAIESADIILVKNDPRDVAKIRDLSQKTYRKMTQNLWWAAGYNIIAVPLAAGVLSGYGVVLPPAVGAIIMSLSTVIVALNSQTLRKHEPKGVALAEAPVMVKDPVCGMEIEPATAYGKTEYKGKTYYFCSQHCAEEFKKNPEKCASKKPEKHEYQH